MYEDQTQNNDTEIHDTWYTLSSATSFIAMNSYEHN